MDFTYLFSLVSQIHIWVNQRHNYNAALRYKQIRLIVYAEDEHT